MQGQIILKNIQYMKQQKQNYRITGYYDSSFQRNDKTSVLNTLL